MVMCREAIEQKWAETKKSFTEDFKEKHRSALKRKRTAKGKEGEK